jgi:hypothetical protein
LNENNVTKSIGTLPKKASVFPTGRKKSISDLPFQAFGKADNSVMEPKEGKSMFQLSAATIAIVLECLIGTATLYIGGALYLNSIDALARVFG